MTKQFMKTLALSSAVFIGACASADAQSNNTIPPQTLSTQAHQAVLAALDDEYKAQSLYKVVMNKHGAVRPFSKIINAEKHHSDMLADILVQYGKPVPSSPYENGMKAALIAPDTLLQACTIGVDAEIENIALYNEQLLPAVTQYPEITTVMTRLRDASQDRHLRAFKRCVSNGGKMGAGMGRGHGKGQSQKMGRRHSGS